MSSFDIIVLLAILFITAISSVYPFVKKAANPSGFNFPLRDDALANAIFLGTGLIHMLSDSASDFTDLKVNYPFAFLIG